jgi:hypothetical protein
MQLMMIDPVTDGFAARSSGGSIFRHCEMAIIGTCTFSLYLFVATGGFSLIELFVALGIDRHHGCDRVIGLEQVATSTTISTVGTKKFCQGPMFSIRLCFLRRGMPSGYCLVQHDTVFDKSA